MIRLAEPETRLASGMLVHQAIRLAGCIVTSLSFIAAITFVCVRSVHVNATTAGFFYLVAILMIATVWGLVESTIASIAAMLCFNYFLQGFFLTSLQAADDYCAARNGVIGSFSNSCRGSRLGSSTITPTYPVIISSQVCSP